MFSHVLAVSRFSTSRPYHTVYFTKNTTPKKTRRTKTTMTPPPRSATSRNAKSTAKDRIGRDTILLNLENDNECYYNMHESEGRRMLTFSSYDDDMEVVSAPGDAVEPAPFATPTKASAIVSNRADGQDTENQPPLGNVGDDAVVSPSQAPKVNFDHVEYNITAGLVVVNADTAVKSLFATATKVDGIVSSRADGQDTENQPALGNLGDDAVVSTGQAPKVNLNVRTLLTPLSESYKSAWKRQMDQVVRKLPQEFGKRDVLRVERAFWMGEMDRVLEHVDVEFFGKDWDHIRFPPVQTWKWQMDQVVRKLPQEFGKRDKLRIDRAFWRGEMARALEDVDVEFFGPDWNILYPRTETWIRVATSY
jgi:hypothetical protein